MMKNREPESFVPQAELEKRYVRVARRVRNSPGVDVTDADLLIAQIEFGDDGITEAETFGHAKETAIQREVARRMGWLE